jgi:hypothetical protein
MSDHRETRSAAGTGAWPPYAPVNDSPAISSVASKERGGGGEDSCGSTDQAYERSADRQRTCCRGSNACRIARVPLEAESVTESARY